MSEDYQRTAGYINNLLARVRYRPGWTIEAFPTPYWDRVWILIDAEVLDSEKYDPMLSFDANRIRGNTTRVGVRAVVPEFRYVPDFEVPDAFYDWLAERLIRCERHESREFFQVQGRPWDSPHKIEQPPYDYLVAYEHDRKAWVVTSHRGVERFASMSWRSAYRMAWFFVIQDDESKGPDMVNG